MTEGIVEFDRAQVSLELIEYLKSKYDWRLRPPHPVKGYASWPFTFYMTQEQAEQEGLLGYFYPYISI